MKIKIFSVGGTIDKVYFDKLSEYQVGSPGVQEVLESLPIGFDYEVESIMRKDSLDMDDADRDLILERVSSNPCERVIITHGTDTMALTGQKLSSIKGKCIVLTGAMEPVHFKSSDAVFNIGVAIGAVSSQPHGVYIAMNGQIFDPFKCKKNREKGIFEEIKD